MSNKRPMQTLAGLATARGYAIGPAFVYRGNAAVPVPEYCVEVGREPEETLRFRRALNDVKRDLEGLISALRERTGREDVMVFECHMMMLDDPSLIDSVERLISGDRLNAAAAVRRTADRTRAQFARMNDAYFRERVRDVDDVERRLLLALDGGTPEPYQEIKSPCIVVADDLTPSETVQLPRDLVLGFVTDGGSTTSHVALLARALGIPAVSGLKGITSRVKAGDTLLLDGTNGAVTLDADVSTVLDFRDLIERQKELSEEALLGAPAGTLKDGGDVPLYANIHPGVPVGGLRELGARGVGLYRSEYLWLNRELEPTEEEQFVAYRDAAILAKSLGENASLTLRVLDIGGDKTVAGITRREDNPFLGNRSIRYLLSHRETFETQLRAALRASAFGKICLLYPMISCEEELVESAKSLEKCKAELSARGIPFDAETLVGAMIEVPAAALNAEAIAKHVDFFSIGTNDLVQYAMAADRGNDAVAHLYQPLHPSVLKLMRMTIDAARAAGIYVGVCGESAADPVIGVLWAAMGVDILSMSATYIPVMSKLFSRLTRGDLDEYAEFVKDMDVSLGAAARLASCRSWLTAKIPDLDNIIV